MRHAKKRNKLNRVTSWHKATIISLAKNTLKEGSIKTTLTRAKVAKPLVEKLISLAKSDTLTAKRQAFKILGEHELVSRLFRETGPLFAKRQSGFTRLVSLGKRRGDNAEIVIFELTERKPKEVKKAKKVKEEKPAEAHPEQPEVAAKQTKQAREEKQERPALSKKPGKKFFGGFKNIFKKERDSL
jgi:large subunit ribosomal protein L17